MPPSDFIQNVSQAPSKSKWQNQPRDGATSIYEEDPWRYTSVTYMHSGHFCMVLSQNMKLFSFKLEGNQIEFHKK